MTTANADRKAVLFVLPNFAGGGAERVALTLLANLDRHAFEPQLIVFDDSGPLQALLTKDVRVTVIGHTRLRQALPKALKCIRQVRPAVVFASQGYVNMALLAVRPLMPNGTRLALRESNTPSQSLPNRRYPWLMACAYRWLYPRADLLFCQHHQTEREMREDYGVAASRIAFLPNPVSEKELRKAAAMPRREPGSGLRFVAAGRLHRQKGFDRLVGLFARAPNEAKLTIYGEGEDHQALSAAIRDHGLEDRVTLAGFSTALPAALAGADACLVSSRWEGLPNIALEALACGTPVIATPESGGISELASQAAPSAVTVASLTEDHGEAFLHAMRKCRPRTRDDLANSLLPEPYQQESVLKIFNGHLCRLVAGSETA